MSFSNERINWGRTVNMGFWIVTLVVALLFLLGCRNVDRHYTLTDDLNNDGTVDECDIDPEVSDPFGRKPDIFDRLCIEHRCGKKCKLDQPRFHNCKVKR